MKPIESKNYERERDDVVLQCLREHTPYLKEEQHRDLAENNKSSSYAAFQKGADWGAAYERRRAERVFDKMKAKIIKQECDCGYEGPDSDHGFNAPLCYRCEFLTDIDEALAAYEEVREEFDPTPWCAACGAMKPSKCNCGPIAENE